MEGTEALQEMPFPQRNEKTSAVGRSYFRKDIEKISILKFDVDGILESRVDMPFYLWTNDVLK